MESFRAADHARETLVNASGFGTESLAGLPLTCAGTDREIFEFDARTFRAEERLLKRKRHQAELSV